jgi:hypothetical protein
VAAAYPLVAGGDSVKMALDEAATGALGSFLSAQTELSSLGLRSCEGSRDGAPTLTLAVDRSADYQVYCDPIDGTLNAARGGPRSFSVLALTSTGGVRDSWFDDTQSIFGIGCQSSSVADVLAESGGWSELIEEHLARPMQLTATLNREDNLALLLELGRLDPERLVVGSRSGYRPSLGGAGFLAVGDATVALPFECDLEFGRIGLLEAQIQSALYSSWCGLAVSRDRIRQEPTGLRGYLQRYLAATAWGDTGTLKSLFTAPELAAFQQRGVALTELTTPLTPTDFGVGLEAVVAVAVLTSPSDEALGHQPPLLHGPSWIPDSGSLDVHVLTSAAGVVTVRRESVGVHEEPAR